MRKILLSALLATLLVTFNAACPAARAGTAYVTAADSSAVNGQKQTQKRKKKKQAVRQPSKPQPPKEAWQRPMTVVLVRSSIPGCEPLCPEWLAAEGEINPATPAVFRKTLKQIGKRWLPVVIRSPGGDVQAALEIGRMVRKAGLPVGVGWTLYDGCSPGDSSCGPPKPGEPYRGMAMVGQSFCLSACPLILAAGTERLAGPVAYVGLHVMRRQWVKERVTYRETLRAANGKQKVVRKVVGRKIVGTYYKDGIDKEYRRKILAYLSDMGVSPAYIDEMAKAGFNEINRLSQERLRDLRLVTSEGTIGIFVSADTCRSARPFRNCRALASTAAAATAAPAPAAATQPPAEGGGMVVVRMRAGGRCGNLCPEWIMAQGVITPETPDLFRKTIDALGAAKLPVVLDSEGGDFDAARKIGRMIRKRGLDTYVATPNFFGCSPHDAGCGPNPGSLPVHRGFVFDPGRCSRECLFVLAGGVRRSGVRPGNTTIPAPQTYVSRMLGADPATLAIGYLAELGLSWDQVRNGLGSGAVDMDAIFSASVCARAAPPLNCIKRENS